MKKTHTKYSRKVLAYIMLAVIGLTVLPVKQFHRHADAEATQQLSKLNANTGDKHFVSESKTYCPICLYSFINQYLPEKPLSAFSFAYHTETQTINYTSPESSRESVYYSLRAPPTC